jgi:GDP-mannose 4,6-dehydratase
MVKILITGVLGFIGSNLAARLINDGYEVYGVVRRVASRSLEPIKDLSQDLSLVSGDISDYNSIRNAVKTVNPSVIFHLAALSPVRDSFERPFEYQQANYIGTMNIAHSLLELNDPQTRRLIAASTAEVYGIQENIPLYETLQLNPSSPYAVSKAAADLYLRMMFSSFDLKGTIMRPANSYGRKYETGFIVEYLITQMLSKNKIYIGSPDSIRDYMYVDDHVNAYVLAMKNPKANRQVYNVGTTVGVSNRELANIIAEKIGYNMDNVVMGSYPPNYPYRPLVSDQPSIILDSKKIRSELDWAPTISLSDGLDRIIAYYKKVQKK